MGQEPVDLVDTIRASVIGEDEVVEGPYGPRRVTYADYTASGRALTFVEDHIREAVLPLYANTHTESSGTGLQTTRYREEAREIVRRCLGGNAEDHALVFCGSGSTAAINRLIDVLNLRIPADLDRRYGLSDAIPADERPAVFIGPYEHHSNELPWRESIADVVAIPADEDGHIDLAELERALARHAGRPLLIGSFSAASNVTGILSDTRAISVLLHRYGALSFWDFAAAAPYVAVEMGSRTSSPPRDDDHLDHKDAIFVSAHKLVGGPGTPGILLARRELFTNSVPTVPGGGTVAYVNPSEHVYLTDIEHREEGGTPAIVESIRAGLVFQLKEAVGVDRIRSLEDGYIDLAELERALARHAGRPLLIGSFSAASNVTGILSDTRAISVLLHRYGALSFWDFAAAAPYVAVEMGPRTSSPPRDDDHLDHKDAIFVSAHKLVGGPGTPGILLARRELFTNSVPTVPGGGTVAYVNPSEHVYLTDIEHREEGGTPAIVESIRAGLVFQLKEAVGVDRIRSLEDGFIRRAIARWRAHPRIEVLGNPDADRLSIVSFVVRTSDGRHLHHNLVVALLNDVFGIQSRGGCSCAGPYGHRLLGIDLDRSHAFEREIARGCEGIKPGWVRVNFNYFISETVFSFILDAVEFIADHGTTFLPHYDFDATTGLWRHEDGLAEPPASLADLSYADGRLTAPGCRRTAPESELPGYLDRARAIVATLEREPGHGSGRPPAGRTEDFEALRWFPLPGEAARSNAEV